MAQPRQVDATHLLAQDAHRSRRREGDGGAEAEQRALTRAVRPEQRPVLALLHGQRDAVDDLLSVAAKRHIGEFQNRRHAESRYAWPRYAYRQNSGIVLDALPEALEQRAYGVHDRRGRRRGMRRSELDQSVFVEARF